MLFDVRITPEQLRAAADWVEPEQADVELLVDGSMLIVSQGDDREAWDTGGEIATAAYLAVAPIDRKESAPCTPTSA